MEKLHFVLIPLPAQGHMIPMIDMAKLLAQHGGVVTTLVTTTPQRRQVLRHHPPRQRRRPPHPPHRDPIPLPRSRPAPGLRESRQRPVKKTPQKILRRPGQAPPPPGSTPPRDVLLFSAELPQSEAPQTHVSVTSDYEPFVIPGMPVTVRIAKAHLPGSFLALPDLDDIREQMHVAESNAYGVVMNTFSELEGGCVEEYGRAVNKKVWCIGPVSLCNGEAVDKFERGNRASIDEKTCLEWLDSMEPESVIYACLGSQCRLIPAQLIEIGLGLEESGHPFVWVIKRGERFEEMEKWLLDERFEERVKGRGLLIKGWAPQVLILSHGAVGGFLTHCGWNSTIEGVCSGIPMMTWPMFAEQFLNEKLVVEVLGIGVRVGVELPVRWGEEERVGVAVVKEQVASAVAALMGGGEEGERRRIDARRLKAVAVSKMEDSGSARLNISALIRDIMELTLLPRD